MDMIIKPTDGTGLEALFAAGKLAESDGAFVIDKLGGATALGGTLCGIGSDYALQIAPDGSGRSMLGPSDITSPTGDGKVWYLRDIDSGEVWSIAFNPIGDRNHDSEISYLPGQATIRSLNNKIAAELTISAASDKPCEIWRVKLENRSAAHRNLAFTTYIEPCLGSGLEARYIEDSRMLVARRSLQAIGQQDSDGGGDLIFFHSSTLIPSAFETEKGSFIGSGRTLRNPCALTQDRPESREGTVDCAVLSLTVNLELPIEGEAEFGFCFGASHSLDVVLDTARSLGGIEELNDAVRESRERWQALSSTLFVDTPDPVLNALVNTWIPYETYAGWVAQRTGGVILDPSQLIDALRRYYPIIGSVPNLYRENLISFAARMSASGTLSPSEGVQMMPSAQELLWLAASTAAYVAETGDLALLDERIILRDGIASSIEDECERAIRMCLNGEQPCEDRALLDRTVRLWSLIHSQNDALGRLLSDIEACESDTPQEVPEERNLPRRIDYLQSLCPTLSEPEMRELISRWSSRWSGKSVPGSESPAGEMCGLYSALSDGLFGVSASIDGLLISPTLPEGWQGYEMTRRVRGTTYRIYVRRSKIGKAGVSIIVDGEPVLGGMIPYFGDGVEHSVEVTVG